MKELEEISLSDVQLISSDIANHYRIVPKGVVDNSICFYISSEISNSDVEELELILNKSIIFESVDEQFIAKSLAIYYREASDATTKLKIANSNDFFEEIIQEAKAIGSSDIHFEIFEKDARVRFRIDGILIEKYAIEKEDYQELVNKIKIKANLDITEKRLPQDGRISYANFDIRTSILPTLHGEKIVLRILGRDTTNISLDNLGFGKEEKVVYLEAIKQTNGIVLISGPTGSGKTTTLYATLKILNDVKTNIVTIEDPIEYTLKGINQVQLKENIGLSFSSALRSFLRQDPDIIMLGEIRDGETAQMAIRASLTGHLVLSTIHTNSALGTISRLVDMGVPSFLIAETLNISVAQRLVRKLCENCKKEVSVNMDEFPSNFIMPYALAKIATPVGCSNCHYTGYTGRKAIYELIPITNKLIKAIKKDINTINILDFDKSYKSLSDRAFNLLANKETSLEEVYAILIKK